MILDETVHKPFGILRALSSLPGFSRNILDLLLATLTVNILSLALPLTLMQVYDRILPYKSTASFMWLASGCLMAMLLEYLFRTTRSLISNWMASRFEHFLNNTVVEKLVTSRLADFHTAQIGTHMDRLNSVYTLKGYYAGQIYQVLLDLPFAAAYIYAVYFLGGPLVMIPLGAITIFFTIVLISKLGFRLAKTAQNEANADRFSFVLELLGGIHSVKTHTLEEKMMRRYEFLQSTSSTSSMRVNFWNMVPANFGTLFTQLALFGVIIVGATGVVEGRITLGVLTACSMLSARALQPFQGAILFWFRFTDAKLARSHLQEIANMERECDSKAPPFPNDFSGGIDLKNIYFQKDSEEDPILNNVSLHVKPMEMVAIHSSDSFASTSLMKIITGKLKPSSGSVQIDDYNISEWDLSDMRGKIEYIPRNGTLFRGTLMENITLFDSYQKTLANEAVGLMGLDELVAKLPYGYETPVGNKPGGVFSSGFIQRICIARALVFRPQILLFDQTDASLDKESQALFEMLIGKLKGKCTVVMVTDQQNLIQIANRLLILENGQLLDLLVSHD